MLIPIRCFTCNGLLAHKWEKYLELLKNGSTKEDALNALGFKRYCCRCMLLSEVDISQPKVE